MRLGNDDGSFDLMINAFVFRNVISGVHGVKTTIFTAGAMSLSLENHPLENRSRTSLLYSLISAQRFGTASSCIYIMKETFFTLRSIVNFPLNCGRY
jgi:hypothetical protein